MKDKIISFILISIIIGITGVIGLLGYAIYNEISKEGTIEINFEGDTGFPSIEFIPSNNNSIGNMLEDEMFEGVEGTSNSNSGNTNTSTAATPKQSRYLYKQLDDTAKIIYTKLYENKDNLKTGTYKIDFENTFQTLLSKEDGDAELKIQYQSAIEALVYENPDIFYIDVTKMYINIEKITKITGVRYNVFIDNGNEISYLADGFYTKQDVEKYENQISQAKNQIMAKIKGMNDYEKIKTIHNYLIDSIQYEEDLTQNNIYDIYGALVSKKCVCEGYAKAFQYLMNEIGIENTIVIGVGTNSKNQTENHAWNYVKLNGQWYAVDVTWDDPIITGGGKLTNKARYEYFLKGSNKMNENHVPSGRFTENGKLFTYPNLSEQDYE